jgi:hypothetical protein
VVPVPQPKRSGQRLAARLASGTCATAVVISRSDGGSLRRSEPPKLRAVAHTPTAAAEAAKCASPSENESAA